MDAQTPAGLLAAALADDPARPFITFYDPMYGDSGRVELSLATFDNWVAKTANFLVDGLAAEPGERVALLLPLHWQTATWLLACWSAGLVACPVPPAHDDASDGAPAGVDVVAAEPSRLDAALAAGAPQTVGVSLHPLGLPLSASPDLAGGPPAGVIDCLAEVRGYGDQFIPYAPTDPSFPALLRDGIEFSAADLVERARTAAARWEITAADRVLSAVGLDSADGLLVSLLAPLAAGASVVLCPDRPSPDALARRVTAERITAIAGFPASDHDCRNLPIASNSQ